MHWGTTKDWLEEWEREAPVLDEERTREKVERWWRHIEPQVVSVPCRWSLSDSQLIVEGRRMFAMQWMKRIWTSRSIRRCGMRFKP